MTPPHLLHSLYILHRSSLTSVHLAEVLYASCSSRESLSYLSEAAEPAEDVCVRTSWKCKAKFCSMRSQLRNTAVLGILVIRFHGIQCHAYVG
ncbi:hypothetical protein EDD16DRAFT_1616007 [Pisolithus croceorrhizus]|nr:hypothetical protein EDD16DRAFT_1616007 [Pisolithus croceorrhizus]